MSKIHPAISKSTQSLLLQPNRKEMLTEDDNIAILTGLRAIRHISPELDLYRSSRRRGRYKSSEGDICRIALRTVNIAIINQIRHLEQTRKFVKI